MNNVTWDDNVSGARAMAQADILISDTSSIRFDFAFLYLKPVITLPISRESRSIFESDYMQETWVDRMSEKIGIVVKPDGLNVMDKIIEEAITNFTPDKLTALRSASVANFGDSAAAIVSYLNQQVGLLSMTVDELSLKQQVDKLKIEMTDLREQISQPKTTVFKD
jgi:hypothetical protein